MSGSETKSKLARQTSLEDLLHTVGLLGLNADPKLLKKAYQFAELAHGPQKRQSGEPYIHHPLAVARILAELKLDTATIVTGILHDTVEDTAVTLDQIRSEFGPDIAVLVDGVTKISQITFQTTEEKQAENFRKMLIAMAQDIRVILVKLADRTHNMRTLDSLPAPKQMRVAQETLDIYAPLANRLGLSSLKREMEDLALRYTKPEIYYRLVEQVAKKKQEREKQIEEIKSLIYTSLRDHGYQHAGVDGRPKHFYSIHKKMESRNLAFEQVYDIMGFRIIVETIEHCYGVLGMIHSLWTPVPGRIKDYIAIPKPNFYQSLHTTVIGPSGEHLEIQIRTEKMHETAERGIAAHWAYKEGQSPGLQDKEKFTWLNRLLDSNRDLSDPNEFLDSVKLDLFSDEVYVFTPKGEIREFPAGSSPLDFAYSVHTDVGNHCIGARVNSRMVPLKYVLKSGDSVEIITSPNQKPNKDWLKLVKTSRAKSKIRTYIKAEEHERSIKTGELIVERELRKVGHNYKKLLKEGKIQEVAGGFSFKNTEDFLSAIGYGKLTSGKVIARLNPQQDPSNLPKDSKGPLQQIFDKAKEKTSTRHVIRVKGVEDMLVRFARCCHPVQGDSVIGFITRGRGVSVHTRNCTKIFDSDPDRLVDIEWDISKEVSQTVKLRVVCEDRAGILASMSTTIKDLGVNISRAQVSTTKDKKAVCVFGLQVRDIKELRNIISHLEGIDGVISVGRLQKG